MTPKYKPKPFERCIICGEEVTADQELVGGRMKRRGSCCAHKACWEREQAERSQTPDTTRKRH